MPLIRRNAFNYLDNKPHCHGIILFVLWLTGQSIIKGQMDMTKKIAAAAVVVAAITAMFLISDRFNRDAYADKKYTVKSGDTLSGVTGVYGSTVEGLKQAANGLSPDNLVPGQVLKMPGDSGDRPLGQVLREKGIIRPAVGLKIVVDKSDHALSLYYGNTWLKSYNVEFGEGGLGDKKVQGDKKTPEGTFYIAEKKSYSTPDYFIGSRWMMLSYPNKEDADRGLWGGLIDKWTHDRIVAALSSGSTPPQYTPLGGRIGIHGGDRPELGDSWTYGCIGLANRDVEDFYDYVGIGTPVVIRQ